MALTHPKSVTSKENDALRALYMLATGPCHPGPGYVAFSVQVDKPSSVLQRMLWVENGIRDAMGRLTETCLNVLIGMVSGAINGSYTAVVVHRALTAIATGRCAEEEVVLRCQHEVLRCEGMLLTLGEFRAWHEQWLREEERRKDEARLQRGRARR